MAAKGETLTLKQRRFVEEYVASDGNATEAYFRAFGRQTAKGNRRTYRGAQVEASKLLSNPIILVEIEAAQAEYARALRISKQRVMREVANIAFADLGDLFEEDPATGMPKSKRWNQVNPKMKRAIQSVKVKKRIIKAFGQGDDGLQEEIEEVEYKLHPKGAELDKLCKKLGFYAVEGTSGTGQAEVTTFKIPDNGREVQSGPVEQPQGGSDE